MTATMRLLIAATRRLASLTRPGIGRRIAAGYVALLLLMALIAGLAVDSVRRFSGDFEEVLGQRLPRLDLVSELQTTIGQLNVAARDALLTDDTQQRAADLQHIQAGRGLIGERLQTLQDLLRVEANAQSGEIAQRIADRSSGILVTLVRFSRLVQADRKDEAFGLLTGTLTPQLKGLDEEVRAYQQLQLKALSITRDEVESRRKAVNLRTLLMSALGGLLSVVAAVLVLRSVTRPLDEANQLADRLASGDFTRRAGSSRNDELGHMLASLDRTTQGMGTLIGAVRERVHDVEDIARTMAEIKQDLGDGAAAQSQAVGGARDGAVQVHGGLAQTRQQAQDALEMAGTMGRVAQDVSAEVDRAVAAMDGIRRSSARITEIISVIDGIAFQTNILALNAAVEAARAGEAGRGFAVVAAEVRQLAQRSTTASREIKSLIEASQSEVAGGTARIQAVTQVIQEVTRSAGSMSGMVQAISAGTTVQGSHVEAMVRAIQAIADESEHHLRRVSDIADVADRLGEVSAGLSERVAHFKTR